MTNKEKLIQILTKEHIITDDFKYFVVIPKFIDTEKQLILDYNQLLDNTRLYVDYILDEDMPGVQLYLQYSGVCNVDTLNKTLNSKYKELSRILSGLLTDNATKFPI